MISIDPNTIYELPEIEKILEGRANLSTLRRYGLVALKRGYLGSNVLDALHSMCHHRAQLRGAVVMKGGPSNHEQES